ncbi:MAG: cation:proton antiporter subunit C [Beijerinckiaceae bacterium]|nr:cation:proton antiporter subunit C [Beijerinckiaceae bacterium]
MNGSIPFALCGAVLVGIGLYGVMAHDHLLRRLIAFNVTGSGVFLLFGSLSALSSGGATGAVPQALIITGIVVAVASTAFVLALVVRLKEEDVDAPAPGAFEGSSEHDDHAP